jgi:hypothetical protein
VLLGAVAALAWIERHLGAERRRFNIRSRFNEECEDVDKERLLATKRRRRIVDAPESADAVRLLVLVGPAVTARRCWRRQRRKPLGAVVWNLRGPLVLGFARLACRFPDG